MAEPREQGATKEPNGKPTTPTEYEAWLREHHRVELAKWRSHYQSTSEQIRSSIERSEFWQMLVRNLAEYGEQYVASNGYELYAGRTDPKLVTKPVISFIEKTLRKNVLDNESWPNQPASGWLLPPQWYTAVNDIVRTLLVVKYLDGVDFLTTRVAEIAAATKNRFSCTLEAREEGYYAAHILVQHEVEIPTLSWDTLKISVPLEIQVTTQLQEVIRRLLHAHYEARRLGLRSDTSRPWQWEYGSDEFGTNYLGHILHYVEGMIMEIRTKVARR